ncbi:hypothetical protein I4U23_014203 [Adineta vaga]|nr:hypothetical protein I4U23_014203 [Adineta vaga]
MVKYSMMKRLTQLLASILFIITVLTIYLSFDFLINSAISNKDITDKHLHRHEKLPTTSSDFLLTKLQKFNGNREYKHVLNPERRTRSTKRKLQRAKIPPFHKSKTGVKINQIRRMTKDQRKHHLTTKKH